MTFILVCATVYRARFKVSWELKSVLQMRLNRCNGLILFVLFKRIYMVTYQDLGSSRIRQEGQGERIQASSGHSLNHDASADFGCSHLAFIKFNYLVLQTKYSEFKDLASCNYRGHFSSKTELTGEMESQSSRP